MITLTFKHDRQSDKRGTTKPDLVTVAARRQDGYSGTCGTLRLARSQIKVLVGNALLLEGRLYLLDNESVDKCVAILEEEGRFNEMRLQIWRDNEARRTMSYSPLPTVEEVPDPARSQ